MRTISIGLIALAVTGCAGDRPPAPEASRVAIPEQWREELKSQDSIDSEWWRSFGDPVLVRITEKALANNPDVAIAVTRVAEARAQFRLADSYRGPNLVGAAGIVRERDVNPGFGVAEQQFARQGELTASYDLDLFGRLASSSAAVRASLLSTQAARDNIRLAVASSTASGYIALRGLVARLAVLRATLSARVDSLKLARRRADVGYGSRLDLAQAEAEYRGTEELIPAAELAIARQENGLSILLGENPGPFEVGLEFASLHIPPIPGGLPSTLLRRRPDIFQAEQQVVAADHSLDAARAAFMPNIQLTASVGEVASTLLASPIRVFSIGGSVLAPIFDSGRLRAQADVAAAHRDQAAFAYRKTVLTAFAEVNNALTSVKKEEAQEVSIKAQRDALARALGLATERYKSGYSPYLEQLDAQRSLLASELALVQSGTDRLTAMVSLYQSLGGGWQKPPDAPE